ncbi:bacteriocin-like protein [Chryseobacterium contaminans]|uniref:bacteriocin-like protein n=2 Tax=Chryseobacterium contaminans TaxID=1423959 RepID=UPI0030182367
MAKKRTAAPLKLNLFHFLKKNIAAFIKNITFVIIKKLLPMKNLRKLAKAELKKINGGNAPDCPPDTTPCLYFSGGRARWRCISVTEECD